MVKRVIKAGYSRELVVPPSMKWKTLSLREYRLIYERSMDYAKFWEGEALKLLWSRRWNEIVSGTPPNTLWFKGGMISAYLNILGKHADTWVWFKPAIIWEGEEGDVKVITYEDLDRLTSRLAGALRALNVKEGDWILFYTPPLIESIALMLASTRIGAPFEPVFTGFGFYELAMRIARRNPKILVTVEGYYRRGRIVDVLTTVRRALEYINCKCKVIVIERVGSRSLREEEISFDSMASLSTQYKEFFVGSSNHPLFGLHSAYEDGFKPITHPVGGFLTQVYATSRWMGLRPHDTYLCTVWPGWITGVSYVVFGPLMIGSTVLIYDGSLDWPSWGRLWDIVERNAVTLLLTTGGALRILSKQDASHVRVHNMDTLRAILVTAEPLEVDVWRWAYTVVGTGYTPVIDSIPEKLTGRIPVVNMYIQSEIGTFVTGNLMNYTFPPIIPGSVGTPIPGFILDVVNDKGYPVRETLGELVIRNPWPSMPIEYPKEFEEAWANGYYRTRDHAIMNMDGYIFVVGRRDTVLKVSGYRLSPKAIEEAIMKGLGREALVVGYPDDLRFEAPLVIVEGEVKADDVRRVVREYVGPIADPKIMVSVESLNVGDKVTLRVLLKNLIWVEENLDIKLIESRLKELLGTNVNLVEFKT